MLKTFAVALLAIFASASAANARGGGAESMPETNFTDLPSYHPAKVGQPLGPAKHARQHARWRHSPTRSD